jgi:hypothetical protein
MGDGRAAYGGWRISSQDHRQAIYHIFSKYMLSFFSGAGELVIDQSDGAPLSRAVIRHDSTRGSATRVHPVASEDGSMYFFQPNSTSISEFQYYDERGSYEANGISRCGRHLLMPPCSAELWKGDRTFDTGILFYVNRDGTMVACALNFNETIQAFTRAVSRWPFRGVCVSAGNVSVSVADGSGCVLLRFVNGNYVDEGRHTSPV